MPVIQDAHLTSGAARLFGEYKGTFFSDANQVRADVFRQGERLIAHVSFTSGQEISSITDKWAAPLYEFAKAEGYEGRFQVVFSSH